MAGIAHQESQQGSVAVVLDGPSGQRLVERLARCGVAAHAVSPDALRQQALADQFYLAPIGMVGDVEALARRGAHLCLIPPWPAETITIGAATVGVAPVEQRGPVRLAGDMRESESGRTGALTSLKILYRERLTGALGTTLAESEQGEPLLATLPRASNLHGFVIVSALQLGSASAQTRFDDVAFLLTRLLTWCAAHAEPAAPTRQPHAEESGDDDSGERTTPIVLLALALIARQAEVAQRADVRATFARICQALGASDEPSAFDRGWAWLEAQGVISYLDGDTVRVHRDMMERYSAHWQLGPRLRRLRQSENTGQGGAPDEQ